MEIALEPAALLVAGLDDAHARGLHLLQLQADLDAQARDLDRQRGCREDVAQRDPPLEQRRVVQQHRRAQPFARDLRVRAPVVRQRGHELTRRGRIRLALGQPEDELGEGVAQRLAEHPADLLRRPESLAHLVLEILDDAQALEASTIEAAVDDALDPRPQRAEGERHDERRRRR